ncbi:PREDICTED: transcription initiation factor TFIID subunit 7-like isoform X1 [Hipposideros armiger]|uniref:Transcription initiation factor TFIID subunit 7-like isoform X1 n=2 Tax=Hipposideros armiger TaxID=186990 RepID=A0A8B7Q7K8_HIPAR|nr:PREDICTED: transcription initiation factor TFIID subunit 7-like isoform X1 [Hipposideros armiger]
MSKSQREPPTELESQFIVRLPPEHASTVRKLIRSGSDALKDKLKIDLSSDGHHAIVEVEDVSLNAKMVDLPCVIGSLKTLDNKTFYKTADISKMLVCTADGDLHSSLEEPVASADLKVTGKNKKRQKKYAWKHGITPPLKNIRKKRFRKTTKKRVDFKQVEEVSFTEEKDISANHRVLNDFSEILPSHTLVQNIDSPDVKEGVTRLLNSDAEALSVRWEVIAEGEAKDIESQGFIPSFEISPGASGYEQGHSSAGYGMFRERLNQSTSSSDDEEDSSDDDDDEVDDYDYEDEETHYYEDNLQRELQAKLTEFGQCELKEGASSIVMEIQKQIHYFEKKLQQIWHKEQRQNELIRNVGNLTLKNHLHSMLEQLKLQKKQTNDQLSYLQEKLKYFLEK